MLRAHHRSDFVRPLDHGPTTFSVSALDERARSRARIQPWAWTVLHLFVFCPSAGLHGRARLLREPHEYHRDLPAGATTKEPPQAGSVEDQD